MFGSTRLPLAAYSWSQNPKSRIAPQPPRAVSIKLNSNMSKFAKLWPDSLATEAPLRDLDYEPDVSMPRMVASVLNAHSARRLNSKAAFRSIDTCDSGRINDYMLEKFVRKYLVRGREKHGSLTRRQDMVIDIVSQVMSAMDVDKDGVVSMDDFMQWSRVNNLETLVDEYATAKLPSSFAAP